MYMSFQEAGWFKWIVVKGNIKSVILFLVYLNKGILGKGKGWKRDALLEADGLVR
jgi:hypothetical protein